MFHLRSRQRKSLAQPVGLCARPVHSDYACRHACVTDNPEDELVAELVEPMKILLVSLNFAPEPTGIGKYSGEMAEGLVARGHEVTVVCAPPYYPTWTVQDGYSAWAYRIERPRPGLTVRRCPVWLPKRLRGPTRLLHLASFALSSLPIVLGLVLWRPHVVLAVAPALACAPGAWLAARLAGAKAWLHVQDFEVDAAFELGILQRPSLRRAALVFERILMRRFDVVSTISSRMSRQLVVKGVPPEHTELIPNWVVLPARQAVELLADLRRSLGIAGSQTVCLFSGSLNRKQGLAVLVEAARLLKDDPRIVFVVCGNGEVRQSVELSAAGLGNMRFIDLRPAAELDALLAMADIHLLPQLRGAADLVMPSKLVGMLASGRPVVAACAPDSEVASVVTGCGIVTPPECPAGFVSAISALVSDPQRAKRLGDAGRARAESHFGSREILDRLHARLDALHRPVRADAVSDTKPAPPSASDTASVRGR